MIHLLLWQTSSPDTSRKGFSMIVVSVSNEPASYRIPILLLQSHCWKGTPGLAAHKGFTFKMPLPCNCRRSYRDCCHTRWSRVRSRRRWSRVCTRTCSCPGQCSCKLPHFCMACGECSSSDLQRYQELGEQVFDRWEKIHIQKGCSQEKKTEFPMKHFGLVSMGIVEIVIWVIISHNQITIYHLSSEFWKSWQKYNFLSDLVYCPFLWT